MTRLRNLKKKEKGLSGRGRLTDATIDRLQIFASVAIRQNAGNVKNMKSSFLASLFHVASSKENNLHFPQCPTSTYKAGPGIPIDIVRKI